MKREVYQQSQKLRDEHWWFLGRKKIIGSVLNSNLNCSDLKILDVGCGSATALSVLSRFGRLTGVDNSNVAVKFCQKHNYSSTLKGDATNLPFPKAHFDLVAALDLLEHVHDDQKALKEFNRVCKNGGGVIITVPAMPFLWGENDILIDHFRRYQKDELKKKIELAGFEVKKLSYFNFFLLPFYLAWHFKEQLWRKMVKGYQTKQTLSVKVPFLINKFFTLLLLVEGLFLPRIDFPWGSSLICFAQKSRKSDNN